MNLGDFDLNKQSVRKRISKEKKSCVLPMNKLPRSSNFDEIIEATTQLSLGLLLTPESINRKSKDGVGHVLATLRSLELIDSDDNPTTLLNNIASASSIHEKRREVAVCVTRSRWIKLMMEYWGITRFVDLENKKTLEFLSEFSNGSLTSKKQRASILDSIIRNTLSFHPSLDSEKHPDVLPWDKLQRLEKSPSSIFEPNKLIPEIKRIAEGARFVRQGTGYISITGYDMIARLLQGAEMRLLVGSNDKRGRMEIADAVNSLKSSLERGPVSQFKISAAKKMRKELMSGGFRVRCLKARHTPDFHAKVQIYDASAVLSGSANLSYNGLVKNIESCNILVDENTVKYYIENFDNYFLEATPIESELIELLDDSWAIQSSELVDPSDAYLRILLEMYGDADGEVGVSEISLADYQEFSVNKSIRDLIENRGSLLVAPTGTGKTIMGTMIAKRMFLKKKIGRVFVISPNDQIMDIWEKEFMKFRIPFQGIKRSLFREQTKNWEEKLESLKSSICEDDLLVIDECHHFRNEGSGRTNLSRLLADLGEKSPYRLLLTATPISKGLGDLNNLLSFVHPTATAKKALDVSTLPAVTYLTHPLIAQKFAKESESGHKFVDFSGNRRFFAKKKTKQVKYESDSLDKALKILSKMPLEELSELPKGQQTIDGSSTKSPGQKDELTRVHLHRSFESSPKQGLNAVSGMLSKNLEKKYFDAKTIRKNLEEIREIFEDQKSANQKLDACLDYIKDAVLDGQKILIFCAYKETIAYLQSAFSSRFPKVNVATLTGDNSKNQKLETCDRFSPVYRNKRPRKSDPQVLIATDCLSEGVDLPDAHIMVNYDLFWTPLSLVQRVGRLDRPTNEKREFEVANMLPIGETFNELFGLVTRLASRGDQYRKMAGIDVVRENIRDLDELDSEQIEHLKAMMGESADEAYDEYVDQFSTKVLAQLATATDTEKKRAMQLPLGASSAFKSDVDSVGIISIVRDKENYPHVLYQHRKPTWESDKLVLYDDDGDAIATLFPPYGTQPQKLSSTFFNTHEALLHELAKKYNCEVEELTPVVNLFSY